MFTMGNEGYRTIKIRTTSYEKLQGLLAHLSHDGWASVGANRDAPPTLADVVDEAITTLDAKRSKRK